MNTLTNLLTLNRNTLSLDIYMVRGEVTLELFIDRADAVDIYFTFESLEHFRDLKYSLLKRLDSKLDTYRSLVKEAILSI